MKRKNNQHDEGLNFWQPASDMFSALMMILMLVILLLCLYLVHIPDNTQVDPWYGDEDGGWGWLIDRGYDILQTDWPLSLRVYGQRKYPERFW